MIEELEISEPLKPRGHLKIELFNAENGENEAIEKHNYVNPVALNVMNEVNARAMFSNGGGNFASSNVVSQFVLTNASHALDPQNDMMILGKVIAAANKNALSGLVTRGSYNSTESIMERDYKKFVFDFTTSQGNGTFQSIYTGEGYRPDYDYVTSYLRGGKKIMTPSFDGVSCFSLKDHIYFRNASSNSATFFRVSFDEFMKRLDFSYSYEEDFRDMIGETFTIPSKYCYLCTDGKYIYMYNEDARTISRSTPEAPGTFTVVKTFTSAEVPETSMRYFSYSRSSQTFVITCNPSNVAKTYLVGDNFVIRKVVAASLGMALPFAPVCVYGDRVLDIETGDTLYRYRSDDNSEFYGIFEISENLMAVHTQSGVRFTIYPRTNFFSRVLLDSPVTKTSAQTMKITYEFRLPAFNGGRPYAKP